MLLPGPAALGSILNSGAAPLGQVPISNGAGVAAYGYPPGYEIAIATKTSNTAITSTNINAPDTIQSLGSVAFDGTAVWLECYCAGLNISSGDHICEAVLVQDGTTLCKIGEINSTSLSSQSAVLNARLKITPSAGNHTYILAAYVDGGNGLAQAGAGTGGAFAPVYIRAVKA